MEIIGTIAVWIVGIYIVGFGATWALLTSNVSDYTNNENVLISLVWPIALYVAITELLSQR